MSERRQTQRSKKRISCALTVNGHRYAGMVLDVSATGVFVQTSAAPKVGSHVTLELQLSGIETLPIRARVARRRSVPTRLKSIAHGGVGLALEGAPEEYFRLIGELQASQEAPPPVKEEPPVKEAPRTKKPPPSGLARKALLARLKKLSSESG
jgi:Tfp pilus assembly protein PilZ